MPDNDKESTSQGQKSITDFYSSNTPNSVKTNSPPSTPSWQTVVNKKRKISDSPESAEKTSTGTSRNSPNNSLDMLKTHNRYSALTNDSETPESENNTERETANANTTEQRKTPKPPPIFIPQVNNFSKMIEVVSSMVEKSAFSAKSLTNGTVRITPSTADDYRKIVSGLRDKNTQYYTFQLKADRAFKVVIRNLHHSIETKVIKEELQAKGYIVRNVANIKHWKTKEPLPLFFVDLEPTENCKSIYELKSLFHTRITVESPLPKREIVQCKRCQRYGHTRTYCTLQEVCVKCGGNHDNRACTKPSEADPKCGLCEGKHPANYKGCPEYKKITKKQSYKTNPTVNQETYNPVRPTRTFADVTANQARDDQAAIKPSYNESRPNRLENLMEQLLNQNAQILALLTTLINKLSK